MKKIQWSFCWTKHFFAQNFFGQKDFRSIFIFGQKNEVLWGEEDFLWKSEIFRERGGFKNFRVFWGWHFVCGWHYVMCVRYSMTSPNCRTQQSMSAHERLWSRNDRYVSKLWPQTQELLEAYNISTYCFLYWSKPIFLHKPDQTYISVCWIIWVSSVALLCVPTVKRSVCHGLLVQSFPTQY